MYPIKRWANEEPYWFYSIVGIHSSLVLVFYHRVPIPLFVVVLIEFLLFYFGYGFYDTDEAYFGLPSLYNM